VLSINLNAVFIQCQLAGRVMLKKGYGKIINVASMASFFGGQTIPAYSASKGGVMQLTKELSNDWVGRGVNVNAIAPGLIDTPSHEKYTKPEAFKAQASAIALGRPGTADEIAGTAVYLASDAMSSFTTGEVIDVNGGAWFA
jgi:2-deoxy-D-gluconate 3-dehydrogenase